MKSVEQKATQRIEGAKQSKALTLDLSGLGLRTLPDSLCLLGHHAQLQQLDLRNNQLVMLPESIGQLKQLRRLYLEGNKLTTLPESIGQLKQLRRLYLEGNKLTALPESIGQLKQLEGLSLGHNDLTTLPESIGQLKQLWELTLCHNQLVILPESVGQLKQLRWLALCHNQLTTLPESIGQLRQLQKLFLHGNDILGIPPEILGSIHEESFKSYTIGSASPADILHYYFRRSFEQTRRLNEAKILLVGQGGVGKTSLVKRIVSNTYDLQEPRTEGIQISQWTLPTTPEQSDGVELVHLNIWDFGGQEIMHATHQFFLTERSLYLLVLDARQGENESDIHYWLKIIQSYGGDSPVLIITNKYEPPNYLDLNERRLALDYASNLQGFFKISCRDGTGIDDLRSAISEQILKLSHVSDELPISYFQVKAQLETIAKAKDFIDYSDYQQLCIHHGVVDKQDQEILIRFLHDLGNVLNFDDPNDPYELHDTNILNPEWVTTGVYKILNSNVLMQLGGRLSTNQLNTILNDPARYPPDRYKFLIEMMRKFELCFDFPDSHGQHFLIPELLLKNEPDLDWHMEEALNFEYHYNVLPSGIMPRFIVHMSHNLTVQPTYWRSGVVLDIDGNRSLIRGDTQAGRVYIAVIGPIEGRRSALSVIRNTFKAIHHTIPKLEVQEKVPLPQDSGIKVDYQHLLLLKSKNEKFFIPENFEDYVSVAQLLNGIEPDQIGDMSRTGIYEDKHDIMRGTSGIIKSDIVPTSEIFAEKSSDLEAFDIKAVLDQQSQRSAQRGLLFYLGALILMWLSFAALTIRFGWDVMEPWVALLCGGATLGSYAYFAIMHQEFSPRAIYQQLLESKKRRSYSTFGLELEIEEYVPEHKDS